MFLKLFQATRKVGLSYINPGMVYVAGAYGRALYSTPSVNSTSDEPIDLDANPYAKERTQCILCKHNITPDYKNVQLLSQFQSPYTGRIYGKHITGLCKARQEQVEREIIKAQNAGFMPTYHKAVEYLHDPKLFDPEKPIRPHKY
ncbi:28S ribosomal protein S18c, mitochondrial [Uranotaenia lowii]|uniref:28S ribosomal protein S18c, mitochondrial n=1 Tax=Uranotaenia lowii TaxID=190385 RepID=UPI002478B06E|nr:28S ribosomal protein S18c, mitochondrial [Uranotaenia lowii]